MNPRKLALPLLVALACIGAGATVLPAAAATRQPAPRHQAKAKKLRVDSIRVGTKAGPLVLRVAADVNTEVGMTVNGKRVRTPFELAGPKAQVIELRSTDGLHAGSNKLQIRATRAGVVSKATRTVKVPGWALLAEAGEDVGSYTHIHAGVGAPTAPGANAAGSVDYRWSIADAPKGTDATVSDAGDPEAELRTQDPGTYVLQEEANPEANEVPSSFDQVTVSVAPKDPPIGAPINTLDGNGAIVIAGQSYGGTTTGSSYVVLERATRNVVDSGSVTNDAGGLNKLNDLAGRYGSGSNYMRYLMIVSGPKGVPDQLDAFGALMKKLGVALPSQENFLTVKSELPFSVIGIPGAPAGAATTRFPGGDYSPPVSGAITGYLQTNQAVDADGTPLYEYVSGDQPEFSTKTPDSTATTDNMVVGGQTYSGSLPAGASAGLHVVVLESLTLRQISNQVLVTNGTGDARTLQAQAAKDLAAAIEKPGGPTVLVQTIGKPSAAGPEWQGIVNSLVRLGANPELVNALNGTTEYALVSRLGSKAPPAEASTAYDKGPYEAPNLPPASLIGTLARSRTSNYVPNLSGTPTANDPEGGMNLALDKIAYQPTQAWPALPGGSADDTAKAEHLICEKMKFCLGANSCPTLRECFWQRYGEDWNEKLTLLQAVTYPGASSGFSAETFEAVKGELFAETADVAHVKSYLARLQEPFEKSDLSSYIDLQAISKNIYDSVQPPPQDNSTSFALGLIGKIAALGGAIPPPGRYAAAGLSAVFGLASYLSDKGGQPILGAEITARSSELAGELVNRIAMARKTSLGLGMMIVSDYGKLTASDRHISTDWALPADIKPAVDAYRTSAKQWFWEALIPTAYPYLIRANNATNATGLNCDSDVWRFPNQPDMFQMNATVGYDTNGKAINAIFFFTKGIGDGASPPSSIGDEMFRPRSGPNPGLGIEKLKFFSPRVFGGTIYHAIPNTFYCSMKWFPLVR
jgi:hypothetical protein